MNPLRLYIIEDDLSVISILEDIVEGGGLGTICGDTADCPPKPDRIRAVAPDLILVDLSGVHMSPCNDLESNLVYSAQGSDVTLTMVNGKVLYEDGERITGEKYLGKTIDVKGIVDYYEGVHQIKVFLPEQITIY